MTTHAITHSMLTISISEDGKSLVFMSITKIDPYHLHILERILTKETINTTMDPSAVIGHLRLAIRHFTTETSISVDLFHYSGEKVAFHEKPFQQHGKASDHYRHAVKDIIEKIMGISSISYVRE